MINDYVLEKLNKYKPFPIYLIKWINGHITYLHLLMPILGISSLFKLKRIPTYIYLFLTSYIIQLSASNSLSDFVLFKNTILTFMQFSFSLFLINNFDKEELLKLTKHALFLFILFFIFEAFLGNQLKWKNLISGQVFYLRNKLSGFEWEGVVSGLKQTATIKNSFNLIQLNGIMGFSNHTGLALALISQFFHIAKNKKLALLSIVLVLFTGSRTALLLGTLGHLMILINPNIRKLKIIHILILFICLTSPLGLFIFEKSTSDATKLILNRASSFRYAIQQSFLVVFSEKPFGVGVERSHFFLKDYINQGSSITTSGQYVFDKGLIDQGPHSTYLKILVENGIFGYIFFSLSILFFSFRKRKKITLYSIPYNILLFSCLSLNGIFDFVFYLSMAFYACNNEPIEISKIE